MRKSLLITLLGLAGLVQAHEVWVVAPAHIDTKLVLGKRDL